MKKNFFKKLSFVLALAMIVTALAPAAGAFAAKAPKLNASTKYLYLSVDGKDEFDFNISNKVKGWKYLWTSANEDVASVNKKNGLTTAEAAGTTKISVVITDKDGEEVDELTATVTVRDNIKELTITNLPKDGKVAVGVAHDFNRSYVTVANKTKGSEGVTRWSVSPSEGATISDMGVFTATKAGEYTITARAFQSKSKYTSWLSDATKYAKYVTSNEATYKVTVAASMVSAKQVNLKKFDLAFDSAMTKEDITKNLVVSYMLGGTKVKEGIKSVSMSADNKTATVEMNVNFTKGTTYVVEYPNMKSVEFVSATTKVEDVVNMEIKTKTAQISKEQKLDIALLNKDGVNIANDELLAKVTVEKSANNLVTLVGRSLYMYKIGEVVSLTATYHTYNWKDGKEIGNVTATGDVTCVEVVKDAAGTLYGWSVQATAPTNFTKPKTQVFKNTSTPLYVVLKGKNAAGDDMYTKNFSEFFPDATQGAAVWKYTSSNPSVLLVGSNGQVFGVSEGTATVVVTYDDVQVGACEITVTGAEKVAMATLSTNTLVLSRAFSDLTTVTFEAKNQLGDDYKRSGVYHANVTHTENFTRSGSTVYPAVTDIATGLTVDAFNATAGTYNYTVKITDRNDSNVSISLNFSVTVQDPGSAAVSYYKVEADKVSYDVKSGTSAATTTANLSVYGYTAAGIKATKLASGISSLRGLGYTVEVKNPDGTTVTGSSINPGNAIISGSSIVLAGTKNITVSGTTRTITTAEKNGSWLITATNSTSGSLNVSPISFEVKNTQTPVVVNTKKAVTKVTTNANDTVAVINDCLTFNVGDRAITAEAAFVGTEGTNFTTVGKSVTLRKIKLYDEIMDGSTHTNVFVEYEVDLNGMVLSVE